MRTLYEILEVRPSASFEEVRKSYRKLALKLHPDKDTTKSDSSDEIILLNQAYEILADVEKRKQYDMKMERETYLEGTCETFEHEFWTSVDYIENCHHLQGECRCGTIVSLSSEDANLGFSRVQCPCCSLRYQFHLTRFL